MAILGDEMRLFFFGGMEFSDHVFCGTLHTKSTVEPLSRMRCDRFVLSNYDSKRSSFHGGVDFSI